MSLPTAKFNLPIEILPRVLATQGANGEQAESWPDPPAGGSQPYMAAQESITGGELISLGLRSATENMRLRIKGALVTVAVADRVKLTIPGDLHNVIGLTRDYAAGETVLTLERVRQQSAAQ